MKYAKFHATLTVFVCALLLAGSAHALTIKGSVVNGTTGDTSIDATVIVVAPSEGMAAETVVEAKGGEFIAENLADNVGMYLIRVDWDGVLYSTTVQVEGRKEITASVRVYESVNSLEGLHVRVPHFVARRHGDHLSVERVWELNNTTSPPRTMTGDKGSFVLTLPENANVEGLQVASMGVPIARTPEPTGEPGVFRVDYPLRPGVTEVGLTYTVPYTDAALTLREKVPYEIHEMELFRVDPDMQISFEGATPSSSEAHDITTYTFTNIPANHEIDIAFSGGSGRDASQEMSASENSGGGMVSVIPNEMQNASVMIMVIMLLALLAFLGLSSGTANPLEQPEQLSAHYNLLLRRLAKLDDLHEADTIPNDAYRMKRAELKTQLASLKYRLRTVSGGGKHKGKKRHVAGVGTRKQTNAR